MAESTISKVSIKSCAIDRVVVYEESAEICRKHSVKVDVGSQEVVFLDMCKYLDVDSIRVEGSGNASINEVTFAEKDELEYEDDYKNKISKLETQAEDLKNEIELLEMKKLRFASQRNLIDNFSQQYISKPSAHSLDVLCTKSEDLSKHLESFLDTHMSSCESRDKELYDVNLQMSKLQKELKAIPDKIKSLKTGKKRQVRSVTVLLDVTAQCNVNLNIYYVVRNASWSPRYDIRVLTADKTMKITYYGIVKQSTEEDWDDAKLLLSTADPAIGGMLPKLGRLNVSHNKPFKPARRFSRYSELSPPLRECGLQQLSMAGFDSSIDESANSLTPRRPSLVEPTSDVSTSMTNTTFEIQRRTTIPSDKSGHKVSVTVLDLSPTFFYETVPKKSAQAYLRVNTLNSSAFPLLAGPSNVFLDGNFICKSELRDVFPGEEFHSWLGVDSSVRIVYQPAKRLTQGQGLLSRTTLTTTTQAIKVKNAHDYDIVLLVRDHIPMSDNLKLKVTLMEPSMGKTALGDWKSEKGYDVCVTPNHHVLWRIKLPATKGNEVRLKYSIETARDKEVHFDEIPIKDESGM